MSKGKTNKKDTNSFGYTCVNLSTAIPTYPTFRKNLTQKIISYGDKNEFPQDIINLNNLSAVNKAIIENKITYVCGNGVADNADGNYVGQPNTIEDWDTLIEKITRDYVTFGGFCFQVILNENGSNVSLYHTDFSKVRVGETDEYGVPLNFQMCNDWTKYTQFQPTSIDAYSSEKPTKGKAYLYYYKDYIPGCDYYPLPSYYSALNYIEADGLLGSFYRNSINNGFAPSVIVTIPSNPSDEAKAQFNKDMTNTFAGTNGANSIVVLYGESQEIKPEVTPFTASQNADLYNNVNDVIFQKIISAHGLTSPTLAGLSGSGSLSGNASEIINAFILYNSTVIRKIRRKILDVLNVFVVQNGLDKLVIQDLDIVEQMQTDDTVTDDEVITTDNTSIV